MKYQPEVPKLLVAIHEMLQIDVIANSGRVSPTFWWVPSDIQFVSHVEPLLLSNLTSP